MKRWNIFDVKIASEDIVVYKVGYDWMECGEIFESIFAGFNYTKDKQYVEGNVNFRSINIRKGFHSYMDIDTAKYHEAFYRYMGLTTQPVRIAKFIIPKGARYTTNRKKECVSDSIVFKRFLTFEDCWIQ